MVAPNMDWTLLSGADQEAQRQKACTVNRVRAQGAEARQRERALSLRPRGRVPLTNKQTNKHVQYGA